MRLLLCACLSILNAFPQAQTPIQKKHPLITRDFDMPPRYPDGEMAAINFLKRQVAMPDSILEKEYPGVLAAVQFTVDPYGKLTDFQTLYEKFPGCAPPVIAALQLMPDWIPGRKNGQPVAMRYTMAYKMNSRKLEKSGEKWP